MCKLVAGFRRQEVGRIIKCSPDVEYVMKEVTVENVLGSSHISKIVDVQKHQREKLLHSNDYENQYVVMQETCGKEQMMREPVEHDITEKHIFFQGVVGDSLAENLFGTGFYPLSLCKEENFSFLYLCNGSIFVYASGTEDLYIGPEMLVSSVSQRSFRKLDKNVVYKLELLQREVVEVCRIERPNEETLQAMKDIVAGENVEPMEMEELGR